MNEDDEEDGEDEAADLQPVRHPGEEGTVHVRNSGVGTITNHQPGGDGDGHGHVMHFGVRSMTKPPAFSNVLSEP